LKSKRADEQAAGYIEELKRTEVTRAVKLEEEHQLTQ